MFKKMLPVPVEDCGQEQELPPSHEATPSSCLDQLIAKLVHQGERLQNSFFGQTVGASYQRQVFAPKPSQQTLIGYRGHPLSSWRKRWSVLKQRHQFWIGSTLLTTSLSTTVYCYLSALSLHGGAFPYLPIAIHSFWIIAALTILNFWLTYTIYLLFSAKDVIICDQFGLSMALSEHQAFSIPWFWTDMDSIAIVDDPLYGQHRFLLEINCRSRGVCRIEVSKLYPETLEQLSAAIEKNAPFCRNLSQLSELKRFQDFENGLLPGVSYTQLWESLTNKNIELTGFAPLQRGYKLQDGRLTILRQVATGGFSAVYLIENEEGAKLVLKEAILPFGVDPDLAQKAAEQFEREARILKALRHPQIASVYDFFVENGRQYMMLEYLPGKTLKEIVFEHGPVAPEKVLGYGIQLAALLEYLHDRESPIVHRDIAPDNLIISEAGKLFLIDFGSANEFVGNATGTLVGKHAYMAPEQIRGKATPISDIYSFGQTIFYCMEGGAPRPISRSQLSNPKSALARSLDLVIQKCTDLDAANRPQSAAEVLALLESSASSCNPVTAK